MTIIRKSRFYALIFGSGLVFQLIIKILWRNTMICKKCNKEIENDNINFCPFCGEKLEDKNNQAEDNKEKDNNVSLVKKIKKELFSPLGISILGIILFSFIIPTLIFGFETEVSKKQEYDVLPIIWVPTIIFGLFSIIICIYTWYKKENKKFNRKTIISLILSILLTSWGTTLYFVFNKQVSDLYSKANEIKIELSDQMKNPSSLKIEKMLYLIEKDTYYIKYSAMNGFGGITSSYALYDSSYGLSAYEDEEFQETLQLLLDSSETLMEIQKEFGDIIPSENNEQTHYYKFDVSKLNADN